AEVAQGGADEATIAYGLGYSLTTNWRWCFRVMGFALMVLAAVHFWRRSQWDIGCYLMASSLACIGILLDVERLSQRWRMTALEQSLLKLAPRWFDSKRQKLLMLKSVVRLCSGGAAVWLGLTIGELIFGFIPVSTAA